MRAVLVGDDGRGAAARIARRFGARVAVRVLESARAVAGAVACEGLAGRQGGEALRQDAAEGERVVTYAWGGRWLQLWGGDGGGPCDQGRFLVLALVEGGVLEVGGVFTECVLGGCVVGDGQGEDGVVLSEERVDDELEVLWGCGLVVGLQREEDGAERTASSLAILNRGPAGDAKRSSRSSASLAAFLSLVDMPDCEARSRTSFSVDAMEGTSLIWTVCTWREALLTSSSVYTWTC